MSALTSPLHYNRLLQFDTRNPSLLSLSRQLMESFAHVTPCQDVPLPCSKAQVQSKSDTSAIIGKDLLKCFQEHSAINTNLCNLCKTYIGDVTTGDCFREPTKQSRWKVRRTPVNKWGAELTFRFYEHPVASRLPVEKGATFAIFSLEVLGSI